MEVVELLLKAKANVESKDSVCTLQHMYSTSSPHWKGLCFSSHFRQILQLYFSFKFDQHLAIITSFMFYLINNNRSIIFGKLQCGSRLNCRFDILFCIAKNRIRMLVK